MTLLLSRMLEGKQRPVFIQTGCTQQLLLFLEKREYLDGTPFCIKKI